MPDNEKLNFDWDDPEAIPGIICKVASVEPLEVTDADLKKINKYALSPLSADDVFIFKALMADNEQDDRNYMPFNLKALQDLKRLYIGRTMLKDHSRRADNQIARIYDTDLVQDANKLTELGELHTELIAKIYMIKTESNKDLIAEIKGGIKKEVSTNCRPEKMVCTICGVDNMKEYCRHYPGVEYTVEDGTAKVTKKRCKMLLDGAKEAYELSFVAVPAQPRAATQKSIGFTKPIPENAVNEETDTKSIENDSNNNEKDLELALKVRASESFIFTETKED
jgi:hypothetical protein